MVSFETSKQDIRVEWMRAVFSVPSSTDQHRHIHALHPLYECSFNAGSALAANGIAGRAFANTQLATAMSMIWWALLEILVGPGPVCKRLGWCTGKPTAVGAACGAVTGLVVITPACGYIRAMNSLLCGIVGVTVVFFSLRLVRKTGVEDRLDCFAFHGIGGATGTLLTGLFASVKSGE